MLDNQPTLALLHTLRRLIVPPSLQTLLTSQSIRFCPFFVSLVDPPSLRAFLASCATLNTTNETTHARYLYLRNHFSPTLPDLHAIPFAIFQTLNQSASKHAPIPTSFTSRETYRHPSETAASHFHLCQPRTTSPCLVRDHSTLHL